MNSQKDIKKNSLCRICLSEQLEDFFNLGNLPLPNAFLTKAELGTTDKTYPLVACFCRNCYHVQLRYIVNPDVMFKHYLYIPSGSKTRMNDFMDIAKTSVTSFDLSKNSFVIDIGSNDGSLLTCFKKLGTKVLGVDPAENLRSIAEQKGIPTIADYFTTELAKNIAKKYKKANVVTATNVFAHIEYTRDLMDALYEVLDDNGVFISQFPYLLDLIDKNQFDTIYHEHLSYFSLHPLQYLAREKGFEIFKTQRNDLDGGSIRVFWKKKGNKKWVTDTKGLSALTALEKANGLYSIDKFKQFGSRIENLKKSLIRELKKIKEQQKRIVGYGAPAKGTVFLNYFHIDRTYLEYVVDSTPAKQGRFLPGVHLEIFPEQKVYEDKPDYLLILAWNFAKEIMEKNHHYKKIGKFIIPSPIVTII